MIWSSDAAALILFYLSFCAVGVPCYSDCSLEDCDPLGWGAIERRIRESNKTCTSLSRVEQMPETFPNLPSLQQLTVFNSPKFSFLPDTFNGLTNLSRLTITNTSITTLPITIGNTPPPMRLRNIDLSNNALFQLPFTFGYLWLMTNLDLSHNALVSVPNTIGNLILLRQLDLSENLLDHLPAHFGGLRSLQRLDLKSNSIIKSLPGSFGDLSQLTYLDISNNEMTSLPNSFRNLTKLTHLNLENNSLSDISTIEDLESLVSLDLANNSIRSLPNLGRLSSLTRLNLSFNRIGKFPSSFTELTALKDLDIRYNPMNDIPVEVSILNISTVCGSPWVNLPVDYIRDGACQIQKECCFRTDQCNFAHGSHLEEKLWCKRSGKEEYCDGCWCTPDFICIDYLNQWLKYLLYGLVPGFLLGFVLVIYNSFFKKKGKRNKKAEDDDGVLSPWKRYLSWDANMARLEVALAISDFVSDVMVASVITLSGSVWGIVCFWIIFITSMATTNSMYRFHGYWVTEIAQLAFWGYLCLSITSLLFLSNDFQTYCIFFDISGTAIVLCHFCFLIHDEANEEDFDLLLLLPQIPLLLSCYLSIFLEIEMVQIIILLCIATGLLLFNYLIIFLVRMNDPNSFRSVMSNIGVGEWILETIPQFVVQSRGLAEGTLPFDIFVASTVLATTSMFKRLMARFSDFHEEYHFVQESKGLFHISWLGLGWTSAVDESAKDEKQVQEDDSHHRRDPSDSLLRTKEEGIKTSGGGAPLTHSRKKSSRGHGHRKNSTSKKKASVKIKMGLGI